MLRPPQPIEDLRSAAEALLGQPVLAVAPAGVGGNSRVFKLEMADGPLALKSYPSLPGDVRRRAAVEWAALTFMRDHNLTAVPQPVARDPDGDFIITDWIEGAPVAVPAPGDIAHAARFVSEIFALSGEPAAAAFPAASEACLSAAEIVSQIERRLSSFAPDPDLDRFLAEDFRPALDQAKASLGDELDRPSDLPEELRRLIPADFGFHNALREAGGVLRYIDFDYFGWDDPVKLAADFVLHPAMRLGAQDGCEFVTHLAAALPEDLDFEPRLRCHLPLYGLRWALIVLNPFRLDRMGSPRNAASSEVMLADRLGTAFAVMDKAAVWGRG